MRDNEMSRQRVLVISDEIYQASIDLLKAKFDVTIISAANSHRDKVLQALPGHAGIHVVCGYAVNKELLDIAGPKLKVISTFSVGYDHLDLPEIRRRGIKVGYTPNVLTDAVAETAVMLTLCAARRAQEGRMLILQNNWELSLTMLGRDLRESTVGIVGLGRIGQAIVQRLIPFKVGRFIYSDQYEIQAAADLGAVFVSFPELLRESDFVIVAAQLNDKTLNMFNDDAFAQMKKTAILVNIGRGLVVNTDALVRALRNKTIFAAGLDVMDPEPLPSDHPLMSLPNAVITPHMGSATVKTRTEMSIIAAQNIINALEGKPLVSEL